MKYYLIHFWHFLIYKNWISKKIAIIKIEISHNFEIYLIKKELILKEGDLFREFKKYYLIHL